jgi:hypothetical protein
MIFNPRGEDLIALPTPLVLPLAAVIRDSPVFASYPLVSMVAYYFGNTV